MSPQSRALGLIQSSACFNFEPFASLFLFNFGDCLLCVLPPCARHASLTVQSSMLESCFSDPCGAIADLRSAHGLACSHSCRGISPKFQTISLLARLACCDFQMYCYVVLFTYGTTLCLNSHAPRSKPSFATGEPFAAKHTGGAIFFQKKMIGVGLISFLQQQHIH